MTKTFAVIWLLLVLTAAVFAAMNIGALTTNITDRVLNPGNLAVLWLVYPRSNVLTPKTRILIDFLIDSLAIRIEWGD